MDNLNILVEAKREYLEQLSILVCPVMIDVFDEMYEEAQKLSKGRKVLIMFQNLLRDVPDWSETMAKEHTANIANRCAWFKDLVAAVFVSSVKILSAVRLSKESRKLSVKLPSNEVFIHSCYKNAAKDLYKNPYIFSENQSEHDRNDKLYERFAVCVENTVKQLIPVQEILQTYMNSDQGNDELLEPQEGNVEEDDVEEYDEPGPEVPGPESLARPDLEAPTEVPPEALPASEVAPEALEGPENPPAQVPFDNEFRTIPTAATNQRPDDDGTDDLFSDAPETRQRKQF
jgi:hypothetical protein